MQQSSNHNYTKNLRHNANALRSEMTKAAACLWKYVLRARAMRGYGFRRERPIGPYIADFVCLELMLVIEVDGVTHLFEETQVKDKQKELYFQSLGYTILRFKDEEVLTGIGQVRQKIEDAIDELLKKCCVKPALDDET